MAHASSFVTTFCATTAVYAGTASECWSSETSTTGATRATLIGATVTSAIATLNTPMSQQRKSGTYAVTINTVTTQYAVNASSHKYDSSKM